MFETSAAICKGVVIISLSAPVDCFFLPLN
jgi:hypothetical protein